MLHKLLWLSYRRRKNILGGIVSIKIDENVAGKGLRIFHQGIVIHPYARIGEDVGLHGNNCIGNNGSGHKAPVIGNKVDIGFGASIIGDIKIADGVKICAGAVVVKSEAMEGAVLCGVPAMRSEIKEL